MTIKQQGGIFGRKPTFSKVDVEGSDASSFDRTGSLGKIVTFNYDGSEVGAIGTNGNVWFQGPSGTAGVEFANGKILPWRDGARANGSIELGSSSYKFNGGYFSNNLVMDSGKGIAFSATSGTCTSGLFDEYEEGIHETTLTPQTGSITLDSAYNTLSYTKVGGIVHVWGQIRVTSVSTPSGYAIFSMPFTAATGTERSNRSAAAVWTYNLNAAEDQLRGVLYNGEANLRLVEGITHAGNFAGKIQAASQIAVSVTYTVA